MPSHDHPGVQSPGEGHPDALMTVEVARQVPREDLPQLPVVGFGLQGVLGFPLLRLEVRAFALNFASAKDPI